MAGPRPRSRQFPFYNRELRDFSFSPFPSIPRATYIGVVQGSLHTSSVGVKFHTHCLLSTFRSAIHIHILSIKWLEIYTCILSSSAAPQQIYPFSSRSITTFCQYFILQSWKLKRQRKNPPKCKKTSPSLSSSSSYSSSSPSQGTSFTQWRTALRTPGNAQSTRKAVVKLRPKFQIENCPAFFRSLKHCCHENHETTIDWLIWSIRRLNGLAHCDYCWAITITHYLRFNVHGTWCFLIWDLCIHAWKLRYDFFFSSIILGTEYFCICNVDWLFIHCVFLFHIYMLWKAFFVCVGRDLTDYLLILGVDGLDWCYVVYVYAPFYFHKLFCLLLLASYILVLVVSHYICCSPQLCLLPSQYKAKPRPRIG